MKKAFLLLSIIAIAFTVHAQNDSLNTGLKLFKDLKMTGMSYSRDFPKEFVYEGKEVARITNGNVVIITDTLSFIKVLLKIEEARPSNGFRLPAIQNIDSIKFEQKSNWIDLGERGGSQGSSNLKLYIFNTVPAGNGGFNFSSTKGDNTADSIPYKIKIFANGQGSSIKMP